MPDTPTPDAPRYTAPYTLKLARPIEYGNDRITELTFQEFEAGWLEDAPIDLGSMKFGDVLRLTGRACGYPYAAMKKLGVADVQACTEVVASFFYDGPATGGTS